VCLFSLNACEESYLEEPPFSQVQDTIFLDLENWFYFNPTPIIEEGIPYYPFSYRIFDARFNGFLLKTSERIFQVDREKNLNRKTVFLDMEAQTGDTIFVFSGIRYKLLIDKKEDEVEPLYYVLRRSRTGVKDIRERTLWLISPQRGIIAAANYDISFSDGRLEMDLIGDFEHLQSDDLVRQVKYYDYDETYVVDADRRIIYKFNKYTGLLNSRDFNKREDLYDYQFNKNNTRHLVDFRILQDNQKREIMLEAGDSCFYFTESLKLLRSGNCPRSRAGQ
ncbi:MAG: hypothetical protein AAGE99_06210, partial [Chlamydiota bacterium]